MKLMKIFSAALIVAAISFSVSACKSGPKDADIEAAIKAEFAKSADMATTSVTVKDGVATISGVCKDDACKAGCEAAAKAVKGVKEVKNECTVAPAPVVAPPASMTTALDATTQQTVKDGLKDIKGVTVTFEGEKAVLAGEVSKADRMKIMQMLAAAKVKSDVSKLMDKK